ncbi:signal peptidase I [Candidatus Berkelbacteria bacterium]|nr:signal peptidase I [Candidatus Berkelbacteria bacterium]
MENSYQPTPPLSAPGPNSPSLIAWGSIFEFLKTIGFILIFAFLIRQFLVQPFVVEGSSMLPNFHNAEYILVDKLRYLVNEPARSDVVIFLPEHEDDNFIKRVIGLPGETIRMTGNQITIDGKVISEPYLDLTGLPLESNGATTTLEKILGPNEYFVLGDNRANSRDSRDIGAISRTQIVGRAWLVLFPLEDFSVVVHQDYPSFSRAEQAVVAQPMTRQST